MTFQVDAKDDGKLLSSILRTQYNLSRGLIRRLKRDGCAFANDVPVMMKQRVAAGDVITLFLPPDYESIVIAEPMPLSVIYEDADVIVVDKPPGVLVHPSGKTLRGTLANGVAAHLRASGEPSRAGPVTRLDRNTSGLVVFAKHPYVHHLLSQTLESGSFERQYIAVVHGSVKLEEGTIDAPIRRVAGKVSAREVGEGGQPAITHFRVQRRLPSRDTVLQLSLETGRTHQIRVHLAHIGHPIIGDPDYGITMGHIKRQALHAFRLEFPHPRTQRPLSLTSPLPPDIQALIEHLSDAGSHPS